MSDLEQYQDKIRTMQRSHGQNNSITIKSSAGGHIVYLGMAGPHITPITPIALHMNAEGNTTCIEFPRQISSGSVALKPTPKLSQTLLAHAGSEGAMFVINVANAMAGTRYTYDHTDAAQAFSKRATTSVAARLNEAVGAIVDAAVRNGAEPISLVDPQHPANVRRTAGERVRASATQGLASQR